MSVNYANIAKTVVSSSSYECVKDDTQDGWKNPNQTDTLINSLSSCTLCDSAYVDDNPPRALICGHNFHKSCLTDDLTNKIQTYYQSNKKLPKKLHCPTCNVNILSNSANPSADTTQNSTLQTLANKINHIKNGVFFVLTSLKQVAQNIPMALVGLMRQTTSQFSQIIQLISVILCEIFVIAQLIAGTLSYDMAMGQIGMLLFMTSLIIALPIVGKVNNAHVSDDTSYRFSKYFFSEIPLRAILAGATAAFSFTYLGIAITAPVAVLSTVGIVYGGIALTEIARLAYKILN